MGDRVKFEAEHLDDLLCLISQKFSANRNMTHILNIKKLFSKISIKNIFFCSEWP